MKKCKSIIALLSICFLIFGNGYIAQATESIIPENEAMGNDAATIDIPFDAINYDGGGNASVNGTWKIWLRSPSGSYSIKPKISVEYKYMSGVEDIY